MNIIITGSRHWQNRGQLEAELEKIVRRNPLVRFHQGGAKGADEMVKEFCQAHGIRCIEHRAEWRALGKAAGALRNIRMLESAGEPKRLLAFRAAGKSNGTDHAIREAKKRSIPVEIIREHTMGDLPELPLWEQQHDF